MTYLRPEIPYACFFILCGLSVLSDAVSSGVYQGPQNYQGLYLLVDLGFDVMSKTFL